ncbi:metal-sulfur cluster assembly factor [Candidatus Nanohalovita haloferacivicina]|uniref:metal-sulfur cluster assembly factor n=1 Tax=Candidatus Nanohalovita haloferacivicina TaxID=2978046 RepID=UPI00325F97E3|nr:Metal-sulfur cluster biosynthetic enzyme [Candidatus Nanohalobia archaeon BNXNv]
MVTEEDVRNQLKEVMDPELDINIVDLGLIYEVDVDDEGHVDILMTLTTPGCPLHGVFDEMVKREVGKIEEVDERDIEVELTFEPRWSPEKMSDEARDELGHLPGMQGF